MTNIIPLEPSLYKATPFSATTEFGEFTAAGTLCGCIALSGPFKGIFPLSPDEVLTLITALQLARDDVMRNARPLSDPRLIG